MLHHTPLYITAHLQSYHRIKKYNKYNISVYELEGGLAQPSGQRINGNKGGGHIRNTIKIDNRIGAWKLSPSAKIKKTTYISSGKGGWGMDKIK